MCYPGSPLDPVGSLDILTRADGVNEVTKIRSAFVRISYVLTVEFKLSSRTQLDAMRVQLCIPVSSIWLKTELVLGSTSGLHDRNDVNAISVFRLFVGGVRNQEGSD